MFLKELLQSLTDQQLDQVVIACLEVKQSRIKEPPVTQTSRLVRTKAEVIALQNGVQGCCETYANRQSCSCLEKASGTTGCNICNDPYCRKPNQKH